MDPNEMTMEQFEALSPEEQRALLEGEAPTPVEEPAPLAAVAPEADPLAAPAPTPEVLPQVAETPEQEAARRGNPEVPLRQLREELRQYKELLGNPQVLLQHLAQQGLVELPGNQAPEFDEDPNAFIDHRIQSAVAPLQSTVQQLQQQLAAKERELEMQQLSSTYQGLPEVTSRFDAEHPHLAGLHPELKFLIAKGKETLNPQAQQAQVEAQAKAMAEQMLTQQLAQMGKNSGPVTLGGLPPAKSNEPQIDINAMGMSDFDKLTPEQIKKLGTAF